MSVKLFNHLFISVCVLASLPISEGTAQTARSITNTAVTETFPASSFQSGTVPSGGTSTLADVPSGWLLSAAAGSNWRGNAPGTTGGWYGNAGSSISFSGTGTSRGATATWYLKNNSGQTIKGFTLSYTAYNYNSGIGGQVNTMQYNINSSASPGTFSNFSGSDATFGVGCLTCGIGIPIALSKTPTAVTADVADGDYIFIRLSNPGNTNGGNSGIGNVKVTPYPIVTSFTPTAATAGSGSFTITVNGLFFVNGATINWNGIPLLTAYTSSTQLTALVPFANLLLANSEDISVTNPDGGNSETSSFSVNNPVPALSGISPSSATAGGAAFTLTLNGTNFYSGTVAKWNGTALTTTYVSATQVTAAVPSANIASAGTASVTVTNATPGGGTTSAQTFTVNNTSPGLSSISPSSATAGGSAFTLTLTGSNFYSGSVVKWNGTALTTTYVSATQVTAAVPAANIASAGTASVTVTNAAPGGGTTSSQTFTINAAANPTPSLSTIWPASIAAGSSAMTITATGSDFVNGSTIKWNGSNLSTTYLSASSLTASVPHTALASVGTALVTVESPSPGGGAALAKMFTIDPAPLPVTWLSFSCKAGPNFTELQWATASETENLGFYIQKSGNGADFKTVGFVKGNGNSSSRQYYNFIDSAAVSKACYRLMQQDFNGKTNYSHKIFISNHTGDQKPGLELIENPVSDILRLRINTDVETPAEIELVDAIGRHIMITVLPQEQGSSTHSLVLPPGMQAGIYTIRAFSGNSPMQAKMIKR
ncbi:MAG: hypothetical protein V4543_02610 [Bacteroidota bacterium]